MLIAILAGVGTELLKPWPLKLIVDQVLQDHSWPPAAEWLNSLPSASSKSGMLIWLTLATVGVFLAGWFAKMVQQYLQVGVGARMVYALSADLFHHLQRLSLRFHGQSRTGDLVKRVTTDTGCVRELVLSAGLPLVTSLLTLGSLIAIMGTLDATLALVALVVTPLLGLCIWYFAAPMTERSYAHATLQGDIMAGAEQTLTALPLVRAFGQEPREQQRFSASWRQGDRAYLRLTASQLQFKVGTGTVSALGTALVLGVGGFQVLNGQMTVGTLVVFLSYVASLYAPLETLAYLSTSLSSAGAGARRVFEVLDRAPEVVEQPKARAWPRPGQRADGHIRLEGVTFGYDAGVPVLRGIDLEACPGQTVALVGPA